MDSIINDSVLEALESDKVDAHINHTFHGMVEGVGLEIGQVDVRRMYFNASIKAKPGKHNLKFPGQTTALDNFYFVQTSYDKLPEIVANPSVVYIESGMHRAGI